MVILAFEMSLASADNTNLGLDNSHYRAQPHPIIVYYYAVLLFTDACIQSCDQDTIF